MKYIFYKNTEHGVTYIELLIYIAIVTTMMTGLIHFAWNVIEGAAKSKTQQEVYSQARYVTERIKYEIRNASGITPSGVSATSISLTETVAANNPTVIDLSGGNIRIKQGASAAVALNSQDTAVNSLTFTNYSSLDNKTKHIGFTFTMVANLASTRQEFKESVPIRGSAELRSN